MGINLSCDECGKYLRTVTHLELTKYRPDEAFVCDRCLQLLKEKDALVDKITKKGISEINALCAEVKEKVRKAWHDREIQDGRSK